MNERFGRYGRKSIAILGVLLGGSGIGYVASHERPGFDYRQDLRAEADSLTYGREPTLTNCTERKLGAYTIHECIVTETGQKVSDEILTSDDASQQSATERLINSHRVTSIALPAVVEGLSVSYLLGLFNQRRPDETVGLPTSDGITTSSD